MRKQAESVTILPKGKSSQFSLMIKENAPPEWLHAVPKKNIKIVLNSSSVIKERG